MSDNEQPVDGFDVDTSNPPQINASSNDDEFDTTKFVPLASTTLNIDDVTAFTQKDNHGGLIQTFGIAKNNNKDAANRNHTNDDDGGFVFEDNNKPLPVVLDELAVNMTSNEQPESDSDEDKLTNSSQHQQQIINKNNNNTTTATTTTTTMQQSHTFIDPLVTRLFVLTTTQLEANEPTPQISTQTFAFSSQYRAVSRALQKMLETTRQRSEIDLHHDMLEDVELIDDRDDPFLFLGNLPTIAINNDDPIIQLKKDEFIDPMFDDLLSSNSRNSPMGGRGGGGSRVHYGKPNNNNRVSLSIYEKLEHCCQFDQFVIKSGLNMFTEQIPQQYLDCLLYCHQLLAVYYKRNNDLYNGIYHSFILHRYVIDKHVKKTFTRELNLIKATKDDLLTFLKG